MSDPGRHWTMQHQRIVLINVLRRPTEPTAQTRLKGERRNPQLSNGFRIQVVRFQHIVVSAALKEFRKQLSVQHWTLNEVEGQWFTLLKCYLVVLPCRIDLAFQNGR